MDKSNGFFQSYLQALDIIPESIRLLAAVAIVVILIVLLLRYIQKSVAWLIVFILLVPTAIPALYEIFTTLWKNALVEVFK